MTETGTGKTTNLTRQIRRAVERFGSDSVLVTSFSRAAAAELAGRDLPIDPDRIGTMHSHCFRALGGPEIAECNVDLWNDENPHLHITPKKKHGKLDGEESEEDDGSGSKKDGDDYLEALSRWRGMMIPRDAWPRDIREFDDRWSTHKHSLGLLDFCDLIDTALRDCYSAPKSPRVIFADEAQDLNPMQMALLRKWGARADYFIVAGDDDQLLYSFTGCLAESLIEPELPPDHIITLKQSYRVPRAVHALANDFIHQVTLRQPKEYLPRDADGEVARVSGTFKTPEYNILKTAMEHVDRGQTVMFLASCAYMLQPLVATLRRHGIPFHNPYRKSNGFWNPLRIGRGSASSRVVSLLVAHPGFGPDHRPWTMGELGAWADWLQSEGILKRGAKKKLQAAEAHAPATIAALDAIFEPAALEDVLRTFAGDAQELLTWWRARVNPSVFKRVQFPADIAARLGPQALLDVPRVVVGTIHSVKGGEADVVFLFPDLSPEGDQQYNRDGAPRDGVIRQFYVGMTRARETLYVCRMETGMAVRI